MAVVMHKMKADAAEIPGNLQGGPVKFAQLGILHADIDMVNIHGSFQLFTVLTAKIRGEAIVEGISQDPHAVNLFQLTDQIGPVLAAA